MQENNQGSFMDGKTIIAFVLVGASWLFWNQHMQSKYPQLNQPTAEQVEKSGTEMPKTEASSGAEKSAAAIVSDEAQPKKKKVAEKNLPEQLVKFSDDKWSFYISSKGMGLKEVTLKSYTDREQKPIEVGSADGPYLPFETNIIGRQKSIYFNIKKVTDNEYVGKADLDGLSIEKRVKVNSVNYTLETKIFVSGVEQSDLFTGLVTYIFDIVRNTDGVSMFSVSSDLQEMYVSFNDENDRIIVDGENVIESYSKVDLISLGTQYFALAIKDNSDVLPEAKTVVSKEDKTAFTALKHNVLSRNRDFNVNYTAFAGPKSLDLLTQINDSMAAIIDFGWFSSLGAYILHLMQFFHGIFGNWGVAIILLTILVRIVVLPFNLMSFKSMKKMQDIQPRLKAIREKHKDDREKLNMETMKLMRDNKVNPLGGCLPMLLQFPVFIALFQVLRQSIELYQAPFVFWITDLSLKDPYYILPVLMGVTMYLQQMLTPTTMDPAQQKVMKIMPVMFALFMVGLPSGLTLYIFISALFAVIQQYFFLNSKTNKPA